MRTRLTHRISRLAWSCPSILRMVGQRNLRPPAGYAQGRVQEEGRNLVHRRLYLVLGHRDYKRIALTALA